MILAGFLPFSVINIQLYDNLSAVWGYGIYTFYNSMSIMFLLLLIITALISVAMTYFQLAVENHEWWWRCISYFPSFNFSLFSSYFVIKFSRIKQWLIWHRLFFCGGSTGLYVYGYGIYYYFYLSDMNRFVQTFCFFGYMACISYGIFLALGTVGFHASLLFVRYLYASIKCD